MNRDMRYIELIIRYCDNLEGATQTFGADIEDFMNNLYYQHCCSFELSQIGETVKQLSTELTLRFPQVEWSDIAKLRDLILHKYEHIDLQILWEIITVDVPVLRKECEFILNESKII